MAGFQAADRGVYRLPRSAFSGSGGVWTQFALPKQRGGGGFQSVPEQQVVAQSHPSITSINTMDRRRSHLWRPETLGKTGSLGKTGVTCEDRITCEVRITGDLRQVGSRCVAHPRNTASRLLDQSRAVGIHQLLEIIDLLLDLLAVVGVVHTDPLRVLFQDFCCGVDVLFRLDRFPG